MYKRVYVLLIILFCTTVVSHNLNRQKRIVGGRPAAKPPEDDPVVYVTHNDRQARIYGIRDPNKGFYVFRGIRFGQPPVGQHRFQRPMPAHLEGEINATKWGPPCPQPDNIASNKMIGSEDCLFLNVFTPMVPHLGDGYPTLIWIHGGGFRRGSACQYEMRNINKMKLIVVTIQYRLGSLGFLSSGTKELPGNNGIFDMMLAVKWVENYIEYFGGNPKKIIPFGHGTGASSAFMLALSTLSRNTFSGLIAMSGSILSHFAIDKDPWRAAEYVASKNECPTSNVVEMIRCLRQIPVDKLIQADSSLESSRSGVQSFLATLSTLLGPGPVIEGDDDGRSLPNFVTETPEEYLKTGDIPTIPLLTGVMNDEAGGAIFGDYRAEIHQKLQTVPNFLNDVLIPSLQNTISNFGNKSHFVPQAFSKYLNVLKSGDSSVSISKVAEAIGDSLYNVPAFLTVDHWVKKSKAFLYSFDYKGRRHYGKNFLAGIPIADARHSTDSFTCHGDDLGYIFRQNTITGEALNNPDESNEEDERVEGTFMSMIAEFARSGELNSTIQSQNNSLFSNVIPTFSSETNSFVSITSAPRIMQHFRYCEVGLWTGLTKRLQSSICDLFKTTLDVVDYTAKKVVTTNENPIKTATNIIANSTILISKTINTNTKGSSRNTKYKKNNTRFLPKFPSEK